MNRRRDLRLVLWAALLIASGIGRPVRADFEVYFPESWNPKQVELMTTVARNYGYPVYSKPDGLVMRVSGNPVITQTRPAGYPLAMHTGSNYDGVTRLRSFFCLNGRGGANVDCPSYSYGGQLSDHRLNEVAELPEFGRFEFDPELAYKQWNQLARQLQPTLNAREVLYGPDRKPGQKPPFRPSVVALETRSLPLATRATGSGAASALRFGRSGAGAAMQFARSNPELVVGALLQLEPVQRAADPVLGAISDVVDNAPIIGRDGLLSNSIRAMGEKTDELLRDLSEERVQQRIWDDQKQAQLAAQAAAGKSGWSPWQVSTVRVERGGLLGLIGSYTYVPFHKGYYLKNNPDVAASGLDAEWHFRYYGYREGRRGAPGDCP